MSEVNHLFMQVDGIKGSCSDKDYKEWIVIENFSIQSMNESNIETASGQMKGSNPYFSPISISKGIDATSTSFFTSVPKGTNIKKIVFVHTEVINEKRSESMRITIENCVICSHNIDVGNTGRTGSESLVFAYGTIKYETNMAKSDGKIGKQGPVGWDRVANTSL
ncbi:Hcp family type VI secretion system effector [Erwinia sp. BNK-24-b]|uniref:Hcp family type VI secretion system effector n=1 Tax=unclassified Erwinia TaxID=2622719 RepID=UPI0039BF53FA